MNAIDVLKEASLRVYKNTEYLAGKKDAGGDFGIGAGGDITRKIDMVAERTVLDYLKEISYGCKVVGEECGVVEIPGDTFNGTIVMDAVDGSANAVRGVPFYCCSLALCKDDTLSSANSAVIINLTNGDIYHAIKDGGAFKNDKKITVCDSVNSEHYSITGLNISGLSKEVLQKYAFLIQSSNHIRHLGANALELCFFAEGKMDIFIDLREKIRPTDMAAGFLVALEAQGIILDLHGNDLDSKVDASSPISFIAGKDKKQLFDILSNLNNDNLAKHEIN